jgi:hypothetical protein
MSSRRLRDKHTNGYLTIREQVAVARMLYVRYKYFGQNY